jgi:putative transposase
MHGPLSEVTEKDPAAVVAFIGDQSAEHGVAHAVVCRVLGVSQSWFYKWRRRPEQPTKREVRRAELAEHVRNFFRRSGDTYGSPRITLDLWAEGWKVSVNTVASVTAELGLQGRKPPRRRRSLTRPGKRKVARDLVLRRFDAIAPNVLRWGAGKCAHGLAVKRCRFPVGGGPRTRGPSPQQSRACVVRR